MSGNPIEPHPPLRSYYGVTAKKQPFVRDIFDDTAHWYDSIESVLSLKSGGRYRGDALLRGGLKAGMRFLDIASGTGVVARTAAPIVTPAGRVICADQSIGMLLAGRSKTRLPIVQTSAEQIAVRSASFDMIAIGFALRHFADLRIVFEELRRVLVPSGRVLILEITPPRSKVAYGLLEFYMNRIIPFIAGAIGNREMRKLMHYYWDTVRLCVPPETILSALRDAGFSDVKRHVEMGIFSEYTAA